MRCPRSICPVTSGPSNKPIAKSDYNEIKKMRESFKNIEDFEEINESSDNIINIIKNNKLAFSYNVGIALLAAYIMYRFVAKK